MRKFIYHPPLLYDFNWWATLCWYENNLPQPDKHGKMNGALSQLVQSNQIQPFFWPRKLLKNSCCSSNAIRNHLGFACGHMPMHGHQNMAHKFTRMWFETLLTEKNFRLMVSWTRLPTHLGWGSKVSAYRFSSQFYTNNLEKVNLLTKHGHHDAKTRVHDELISAQRFNPFEMDLGMRYWFDVETQSFLE